MYTLLLLVSALSAPVFAAPVYPNLDVASSLSGGLDIVSEFFNLLASKVQQSKQTDDQPLCDLSSIQSPPLDGATALPGPSAGLTLTHVAIGRGTQNYTCEGVDATAAPVQVGALATLFNASCVAALYPDLLDMLPAVALQFNLSGAPGQLGQVLPPTDLGVSGEHYFPNSATPFFDLDVDPDLQMGQVPCSKNATVSAPADAPRGRQGDTAVPWLKLTAKTGATGGLQEVYRVQTAGGNAPATCAGISGNFTVQYSAQYWFYKQ